MQTIITTPRLILRTPTEDDFSILYKGIFPNEDVMQHVLGGEPFGEEYARGFFW